MSSPLRNLCLFEDHTTSNLLPLVYTRPVFDLRCGVFTLREKLRAYYPGIQLRLWCREELIDLVREQHPGGPVNTPDEQAGLYVNGRVVMDEALARLLTLDGPECVFMHGCTLVAARVRGTQWPALLSEAATGFSTIARIDVTARLIEYPWDLIRYNAEEIRQDCARLAGRAEKRPYPGVHLLNDAEITIGTDTVILPGVVLDATDGPISIGRGVRILPHAYIQGPACIGDGTLVKAGARIYEGTTIGPVCKVAGEVEASIIHGYSNKQHDGFLGHVYLGQWINLGAGTTNSDLKNTYGSVTVQLNDALIDTGMTFVGLFMGDYSKSAINTVFNTGTVVGFSSNVFTVGFPPKFIPSFSWCGPDGITEYRCDKALEVAQRVMARRTVTMGPAEAARFARVFEETKRERKGEAFAH